MRLGAPLFEPHQDPEQWIAQLRRLKYGAAYSPVGIDADEASVAAYRDVARKANIVISEVGAWSNPVSSKASVRNDALRICKKALDLADRIGARCCVNIAGSTGEQWDGPHPGNLTQESFDRIVETVREIIDAVRPRCAFYTLETMPWMYPDSPESYVRLIKAIHRRQFAVHLDPVNMICSPQRYFNNGAFLKECFRLLGPRIRSCHAKDVLLHSKLTTHLDEVRPGAGALEYPVYLKELARLDPDTPLMLEHLPNPKEYLLAGKHIRSVASQMKVKVIA